MLPQKLGLDPLENWASEPRIGGNLKKLGASGETWVRAVLVTLASGELTWGGSWLIGDRLRYQHLSPHCGYHSYITKLYVSSVLVLATYGRSSELG